MKRAFIITAALVSACHRMGEVAAPSDDSTLAILGTDNIACGAVAVTSELAVTASHCVPETIVRYLMAPDGKQKSRPGRGFVVVRDPKNDLAVFATSHLVPAELREEPPELDGVASMVAHVPKPWGVVAIHPDEMDDGFVRTERLRVGASGSGLWDSNWRLVGVAVGNDNQAGYFATAALIRALVREVPRDARGRIQKSDQPKVCGNLARDLSAYPDHPDAVNVPALLDKASEKNHRIDEGLAGVSETIATEAVKP
jgi:hypothetical protein